jgi:hemerythrin
MKKRLEWDESLSVKVKEIDEQHKKLFSIINSCCVELKDSGGKNNIRDVLMELIEFSRVHFSTEEKYFTQCDYLGAEEHIAEHNNMIVKVLDFKNRFDDGEDIMNELDSFLVDWWDNHLKKMDMKYVDAFQRCGLK